MKNLIIIGNGFDRAHNMRTGYNEFIEDLFAKYFEDKNFCPDILKTCSHKDLKGLQQSIKHGLVIGETDKEEGIPHHYRSRSTRNPSVPNLTNKFVEYLLYFSNKDNWYDIEYSYFKELMCYCDKRYNLSEMHNDFEVVKKYLANHLIEQEKNVKKIDVYEHFFKSFSSLPNSQTRNLIVNFNYTRTIENLYKNVIKCPIVYIHGELGNDDNPMIFGYAAIEDEINKLLAQNNNEFLRNIKKHLYKRTKNERILNDFLTPRKKPVTGVPRFEQDVNVFILGHSCGLSDNLILSEIFNSESIHFIKTFYYENYENYSDTQINIDRISHVGFEKLVNFQASHRMPQWNDSKSQSKSFIEYAKTMRSQK